MVRSKINLIAGVLFFICGLQAAPPDIRNLECCVQEVREASSHPPLVLTFDPYMRNYQQLLIDLEASIPRLPYVYQQAAGSPFLQFLQNLGEWEFLTLFATQPMDERSAVLQQMIPDAAIAILSYDGTVQTGVEAFQEVVSDLYDTFLNDEVRVGKETRRPIRPPTYGILPPLVKFGNPDAGPYTWTGDTTAQVLGLRCGIVSLPPAQMVGGLLAWPCLGHETGGHDVTHANAGMLEELAQVVHAAVIQKCHSSFLADYWARCIDEAAADVCGYLHMGPSVGVGLIGYFRALGDGHLRTVGSASDPHPIDLLRGYLASEVVKRLHFKDGAAWSRAILEETDKDRASLGLVDGMGVCHSFSVSMSLAIQSTGVVADAILKTPLKTLQGHFLQQLQDWTDQDEAIVDQLVSVLKVNGTLPPSLRGSGCFASYVVAAATVAALQYGANVSACFQEMQEFLVAMHRDNPTWSLMPTDCAIALLEKAVKSIPTKTISKHTPRVFTPAIPDAAVVK
jgi:hypothetical protein